MRLALVTAACAAVFACTPPVPCANALCDVTDAGESPADAGTDAGTSDAGAADAGPGDAGTLLNVSVGANRGVMDRAQHGLEQDGGVLYVEAHFGGDPACPTMTSPTPSRTLIIAGLRPLPAGSTLAYDAGLRVTLLDFQGTLTTAPLVRAVDARAVSLGGTAGTLVRFSLEATFADGGVSGTFAAEHCASLDGP